MSEVIDRLAAALNAHDLESAAALLHEDYRSEQPAHPGRAFTGRAQMHANWAAMFAGIPDFRSEVIRTVDDGNTTWIEWAWSGNRSDGAPFHMRGVAIFEVTDGLVTAGRLYLEDVENEWVDIEQAVESLSGQRPQSNRPESKPHQSNGDPKG
jgi:ketosteroid isomerase-like protein